MNCQYCGKPVGLLRRLKSNRYCSAEHQVADEVNPAAMVLKTLLQNGPPSRGAASSTSIGSSKPPSNSGRAPVGIVEASGTAAEDADHAAVLSALLGNSEADATSPAAGLPPDPPSAGFSMEVPEARFQGSSAPHRVALVPKCLELEWVDCLGELAVGNAVSRLANDPRLLFYGQPSQEVHAQPSPAAVAGDCDGDMPWAEFARGFEALQGPLTPTSNLEWLRHRPGTRPSHQTLVLSASLISGWESRAQEHAPQESAPALKPADPTSERDLQDSLMAMLMKLPG